MHSCVTPQRGEKLVSPCLRKLDLASVTCFGHGDAICPMTWPNFDRTMTLLARCGKISEKLCVLVFPAALYEARMFEIVARSVFSFPSWQKLPSQLRPVTNLS